MPTSHFVSIDEANSDVERYLQVQDVLTNPKFLDSLPDHAQLYLKDKLLSFVFYKDQIDAMFKASPGANALRIYNGAHFQKGYEVKIAVASYLNPADETYVANRIVLPPGPGQYPVKFRLLTSRPVNLPDDGNIQQKEGQ